VEIWTPYGKSNDALLLGHRNFYTETHWQHIVYLYDSFYLGEGPGRFVWEKTQYVLWPSIVEEVGRLGISLEFALDHMFNVAQEFGVFLRVDKKATRAINPQYPRKVFGYSRTEFLEPTTPPGPARLPMNGGTRELGLELLRRVSGRVGRLARRVLR